MKSIIRTFGFGVAMVGFLAAFVGVQVWVWNTLDGGWLGVAGVGVVFSVTGVAIMQYAEDGLPETIAPRT